MRARERDRERLSAIKLYILNPQDNVGLPEELLGAVG